MTTTGSSMSENVHILYPAGLAQDFDLHLTMIGLGVNPAGMRRVFWQAALRLNTLTDFELAALGISRSEIPAEVMRHRFPGYAPELMRSSTAC